MTCERLLVGDGMETVNAATMALLLVCAVAVLRIGRSTGDAGARLLGLVLLAAAAAGLVYHMRASGRTALLDLATGLAAIAVGAMLVGERIAGRPAGVFALFIALGPAAFLTALGAGVSAVAVQLPVVILLIVASLALQWRAARGYGAVRAAGQDEKGEVLRAVLVPPLGAAQAFALAAAFMLLALVLHAADAPVCALLPRGTHGAAHGAQALAALFVARGALHLRARRAPA